MLIRMHLILVWGGMTCSNFGKRKHRTELVIFTDILQSIICFSFGNYKDVLHILSLQYTTSTPLAFGLGNFLCIQVKPTTIPLTTFKGNNCILYK